MISPKNFENSENPDNLESDLDPKTESRLGDELNRLLHSLGSPNLDAVSGVFGLWNDLVGDQVAQHVTPIKLDRGRLLIEVDDPAWSTHMKFLERDICTQLSHHTGTTISGVDIRVKSGRANS